MAYAWFPEIFEVKTFTPNKFMLRICQANLQLLSFISHLPYIFSSIYLFQKFPRQQIFSTTPFSEFFLNKVYGLQVGQSPSSDGVQKLGKVHPLVGHDGKVQSLWKEAIADVTNLEDNMLGLLRSLCRFKLQGSYSTDLVVIGTVQIFDKLEHFLIPVLFPSWNILLLL